MAQPVSCNSCWFHNRKVKKTPLSVVHRGSNMDLRGYSPSLLVSTGDCLEITFRMVFQVMWSTVEIWRLLGTTGTSIWWTVENCKYTKEGSMVGTDKQL